MLPSQDRANRPQPSDIGAKNAHSHKHSSPQCTRQDVFQLAHDSYANGGFPYVYRRWAAVMTEASFVRSLILGYSEPECTFPTRAGRPLIRATTCPLFANLQNISHKRLENWSLI